MMAFSHLKLALLVALVGCGSTPSTAGFGDPGTGSDGGPGVDGGPLEDSDAPPDFDVVTIDANRESDAGACSDDLQKIFVISTEGSLYRFDPTLVAMNAGAFTNIGPVSCPGETGSPFSMAVDRNGVAWVNFEDGSIFHVSIENAACTPTAYVPSQSPSFKNFGMAFVAASNGSTQETLFVAADDGSGVAVIDTTTLQLTPRGSYGMDASSAELTGTADARLFAFLSGSIAGVASLGQVDTTTGILSGVQSVSGLNVGMDFAYAFWGGTFWLFTNGLNINDPMLSNGSVVTQYDYTMNVPTQRASNLGFDIVGAGVSTCAPLVMPPPQ